MVQFRLPLVYDYHCNPGQSWAVLAWVAGTNRPVGINVVGRVLQHESLAVC
jgi:hypothetical protein